MRSGHAIRPDLLVVVLDDAGYADLGCFGSEIATPYIDSLARGGLQYSNFHTAPLCSPTRASLLTGRNSHSVGMGFLADVDMNVPHSRACIAPSAATLPEMLRPLGYRSYAIGKWHLSPAGETSQAGPFRHWPLGRGFDRFYGFLGPLTDQYHPELVADNAYIDPPTHPGYHLSEDLTDHAIDWIRQHKSLAPEVPYFLYLAPGAVHAPHQAPDSVVDQYVAVFAKGWDRTREDRLARQISLGIAPQGTRLTERNPGVPPWEELSEAEQIHATYLQAAYAGYLSHFDSQLGRLLQSLERLSCLDDTLIILISDNGAEGDGGPIGSINLTAAYNGLPRSVTTELKHRRHIGSQWASIYPMGWAMAGNTPFRRYKAFVDAGGVNCPLIIHWPRGIPTSGQVRGQFSHAIDVVPTILDVLGATPPSELNGIPQMPVHGASLVPTFGASDTAHPRTRQYYETMGQRAMWWDDWRAVAVHSAGTPYEADIWQLYDLRNDFSESADVSAEFPQKLRELEQQWSDEADQFGVLPLDDRPFHRRLFTLPSDSPANRRSYCFFPSSTVIPRFCAPNLFARDYSIAAEGCLWTGHAGGIIASQGDARGGYALFLLDGYLMFEYNYAGKRRRIRSPMALDAGEFRITFRFDFIRGSAGAGSLWIGDRRVARGRLNQPLALVSTQGLRIGHGGLSPVSHLYGHRGSFWFSGGRLDRVLYQLGPLESDPGEQRSDPIPPQ